MNIKVVVHEAEEGGYWAECLPFRGARPKGTPWKN